MIALLNRQAVAAASRTAVTRSRPLSPRIAALVPHRAFLAPTTARYAANPQSGKPASDNLTHMTKNIKEEASSIINSVSKSVSGVDGHAVQAKGEEHSTNEIISDAKSIIQELAQKIPQPALIWGASGVIPYVSTAGASIYLARQAQLVALGLDSHMDYETASALLLHAQNIQVQFGAVLLSFLGAIHWGFEFSKFGGEIGNRRYVLGLLPIICAWPTLLLDPQMALVAQWSAYVGTWFIDLKATTAGWAPRWYSSYRFGLTLAVGTSIIVTLAGTNYYDADKSRSSAYGGGRKLAQLNKEDAENRVELMKANAEGNKGTFAQKQKVGGDVESQQAGDDADGFVQIRNPKRMEEERKKKEKEEKEKKEKEEKAKKEKKEQEEKEKKAKKDEEVNKLKKQAGTYKGDDGEEEEGGDEGGEEEEGDDDKEDK